MTCSDINECASNNGGCDHNATCMNTAGSFTCTCNPGYSGPGTTCTQINPCLTSNGGCDANATCTNNSGFAACQCKTGYMGSGTSCTQINPCLTSNGGCDANATCTNNNGAPACQCKSGYTGSGTNCTQINPCLTSNGGCDANATCTNNSGAPACQCKTGYMGSGMTCTQINPCTTNNGGCDANATCTNNSGAPACQCKTGYMGSGMTCTQINPCLTSNGGCDANATCTNNSGAPACQCKSGYTGSGTSCQAANTAETMALKNIAAAMTSFHTDTGGWPWGNTVWDYNCLQIDPGPFTTHDTALFSQIVGQPLSSCNGVAAGGPAAPWQGPYLTPGPSMGSSSQYDIWGHVLLFAFIRPSDGNGGGVSSAPNGAILIWSAGPDGLDQTGCTMTAAGSAGCMRNYVSLAAGQPSVQGADDIIVLVGPAYP
jgi:hypothetical protein